MIIGNSIWYRVLVAGSSVKGGLVRSGFVPGEKRTYYGLKPNTSRPEERKLDERETFRSLGWLIRTRAFL